MSAYPQKQANSPTWRSQTWRYFAATFSLRALDATGDITGSM
jgi:hypothetical protein